MMHWTFWSESIMRRWRNKTMVRSFKMKSAVLDKALQMYNLRRHYQWDPVIYQNRMREVRDYCVSNKKCHRLEPYKPMASRSKTPYVVRGRCHWHYRGTHEEPSLHVDVKDLRQITIEDGISPPIISLHPSPRTPRQLGSDTLTHTLRGSQPLPLQWIVKWSPSLWILRTTAEGHGTLLKSMEPLTDGQNLGNPVMRRIVRVLLRITLKWRHPNPPTKIWVHWQGTPRVSPTMY